jgi:DMSO/TMAO reductase YedYZ heme-binding membrane subunit
VKVPHTLASATGWSRRLAGRRQQALRRLASVSGVGGVFHYYWQVEATVARPAGYGVSMGLLLLPALLVVPKGAAASRRAPSI